MKDHAMRTHLRFVTLGIALFLSGRSLGQDATVQDKLLADALKDMHNKAADVYNGGDPNGCYRMLQGGLFLARPLLAQKPELQQLIDQGVQAAERQPSVSGRARTLHETIEALRSRLKQTSAAKPQEQPAVKPEDRPAAQSQQPPPPPMNNPAPPPMPPTLPPAAAAAASGDTLWKRLGEEDGVAKIVDQWLTLALVSKDVNFTRGDTVKITKEMEATLKQRFATYFGQLAGGPVVPASTRSMADVHQGMKITAAEFDAFLGCLKTALEMNKVAPQDIEVLLQKVSATKKDIAPGS
jgi:truncated hemoglobin YjbI